MQLTTDEYLAKLQELKDNDKVFTNEYDRAGEFYKLVEGSGDGSTEYHSPNVMEMSKEECANLVKSVHRILFN